MFFECIIPLLYIFPQSFCYPFESLLHHQLSLTYSIIFQHQNKQTNQQIQLCQNSGRFSFNFYI